MEQDMGLLKAIDFVSDKLLQGDETVFEDINMILPVIGEVLDGCISNIEKIREAGYDILPQDIEYSVERLTEAVSNKDVTMLIDVLCFEIYGMAEGYFNGR